MNLKDSSILITGGTGSFGKKFISLLLSEIKPRRLIVFSRDELKQYEMQTDNITGPNLRYFIGDIRDPRRLKRAFHDVDIVVHAAALKQVPACEYNPIEAVETNISGARNIIDAAIDCGVKRVIALSTDKAAAPTNLYGATKLVAEKLFTQANSYSGGKTIFSCVRYGNVIGSRGSVIPLFAQQKCTGVLTVTDPRMSRFWITLNQGTRFVLRCIEEMTGGEVFVPKIPSIRISRLIEVMAPGCQVKQIGIRPGEKLHEVLITEDEARNAVQFEDMFVIKPNSPWWKESCWAHGEPLPEGYSYTSDNNPQVLSDQEILEMTKEF